MPPIAQAKKPGKPSAPKKPSTRSKTGNDACSRAASNWQLAIRGKAALEPDTYKTLGKCRAMARQKKQAVDQGRTGKLSEKGQAALEGRLQKRFDQGLITQKSRSEELKKRLKQRAERNGTTQAKPQKETVARLAPTEKGRAALRPVREPKPGLADTKRLISQVKAKEKARAETQSGVRTLKTSEIQADPERFQYKMNTAGPIGVTDQFKETKVWNKELAGVVQVWKDPANGITYVVNGHHRYELAQRLGVKSLNVQYIQAKDAAEARQKGALTNIAEGRGTSVDAGRFFRDSKSPDIESELKQRGISLSERNASEGLALRGLAPQIWRKVVDETTPLSRAVAIGRSGLRPEDQLQLFNRSEKGNWTSGKTAEFGQELKRAPLMAKQGGGLFDDEEFVNLAEFRAMFADRFKGRMRGDANLFGKISRSRNVNRIEQVGQNKIDTTSSQEQARQADQALQMFDIERNYGLTSRELDRYAGMVAGGKKLDKVYPEFERRIMKLLDNAVNKEQRQKEARNLKQLTPEQRREVARQRRARAGR